mgnify:CR=1 FL=1
MVEAILLAQSARFAGWEVASATVIDLSYPVLQSMERDLEAAHAAFGRARGAPATLLLPALAGSAASLHALASEAERCVYWANRSAAGFNRILNNFGPEVPAAYIGAEYVHELLAACAIESGGDLRPVFSTIGAGRARNLAIALEVDLLALNPSDRDLLQRAREQLRRDAAEQNRSELVAATVERHRRMRANQDVIDRISVEAGVDGRQIERALAQTGARAALLVTSGRNGGSVMGVGLGPQSGRSTGRAVDQLGTAALEAAYGREIGSPPTPSIATENARFEQRSMRRDWLSPSLSIRSPANVRFVRSLEAIEGDLWGMGSDRRDTR